jgi:hypothetical protein
MALFVVDHLRDCVVLVRVVTPNDDASAAAVIDLMPPTLRSD